MAWCPKCKSEYRDGFTVCADCGCELVDEAQLLKLEKEKALAKEKAEQEGWMYESESEEAEEAEAVEEVSKETKAAVERLREDETARKVYGASARHQDSRDRANDNRSSAWILLIIGTLGIIVLVLGISGVIPLNIARNYLVCGVMFAIFILFIFSGIVSMKNAKFFEKKAESENTLRDSLLEWCSENLKADEIDRQIGATKSTPQEMLYFRRVAFIKFRLNHQFVNLDQSFVDAFIDDYIYDTIFESNED